MSTNYLNTDNILRKVYDPSAESLKTTAVASFVGGSVEIAISDLTDSIKIGDGTGNYLDVNPDGSINVNLNNTDFDIRDLNANQDNILILGSEDGLTTGIKHTVRIDNELDLRVGISDGVNKAEVDVTGKLSVKDIDAQILLNDIKTKLNGIIKTDDDETQTLLTTSNTVLNNILTQLNSGILKVDDDETQTLLTSVLSQLQSGGLVIGTEDGTPTGTQHVFVNNLKKMILDSSDRVGTITWLDISDKKNRRVDKIDYTSSTFPGITARKQFSYTLVGTDYVRTSPGTWSLV